MKFINYNGKNRIVEKERLLYDKPTYLARPIYGNECRPAGVDNIDKDKAKEVTLDNEKEIIQSMLDYYNKLLNLIEEYYPTSGEKEEVVEKVKNLQSFMF